MSTAAKHTPGPWRVVESTRIYDDTCSIEGAERRVALVPADDTKEIEDGAIVESLSREAKANAALIAAAPDLLAALERAEGWVLGSHGEHNVGGKCDCDRCETVRDVRAALAKARGE